MRIKRDVLRKTRRPQLEGLFLIAMDLMLEAQVPRDLAHTPSSEYPDYLEVRKYLGNFSSHRREVTSRAQRPPGIIAERIGDVEHMTCFLIKDKHATSGFKQLVIDISGSSSLMKQEMMHLRPLETARNLPVFTIPKTGALDDLGRPLPRTGTSADHLAPGHYPVERDFPTTSRRYEEIPSGWLTRSARVKQVFMPFEARRCRPRGVYSS